MKIRQTTLADLPVLLETYEYGRQLQRMLGNYHQWRDGHPRQEILEQDIQSGNSFVCVIDEPNLLGLEMGTIVATFYISEQPLPLFDTIYNGNWLNGENYVTIQRMCTNGKIKGASQVCMQWIIEHYQNVKIYTHETNSPMIHVIQKYGFAFCGHILPEDGEPRNAYQYAVANQFKEVM